MASEDLDGFLLGPSNLRLSPAARPSAVSMLHKQVAAADLPVTLTGTVQARGAAVVVCHVVLEGLGVRAGWRLPARLFSRRVEIVGKVLGVGVADLPSGWKTSLYLYRAGAR